MGGSSTSSTSSTGNRIHIEIFGARRANAESWRLAQPRPKRRKAQQLNGTRKEENHDER
jgi:hypothetical protein